MGITVELDTKMAAGFTEVTSLVPMNSFVSYSSSYSLYRLLRLIQLEPLNVETSFKLLLHFFLFFFPFFTLLSFFYSSFQNCKEYTFSPGFAILGGIRIAACS